MSRRRMDKCMQLNCDDDDMERHGIKRIHMCKRVCVRVVISKQQDFL